MLKSSAGGRTGPVRPLVLLMLLSPVVRAQNAPADPAGHTPADDTGNQLQEVVVTGQKRIENVQEVPKQVEVASQVQLTNAGVSRLVDLQTLFPSITPTSQSQNTQNPGIRGIAPISGQIGVTSQTGIVVDDFPQATFSTLANELTDVERVEVFAGPQSTLSGRNAASGLINIVTRAPTATARYDVHLEQTDDQQTRVSAIASGPLNSTLGYSFSAFLNKWDGPYRNVLDNGESVGGFNSSGFRGKLRWAPTDALTIQTTAFWLENRRLTAPFLTGGDIVAGSANTTDIFDTLHRPLTQIYPGIRIGQNNQAVYGYQNGVAYTKDRGGTLRVDYDVGAAGTVSSLTSYTHSNQPRNDVFFGAPQDNLVIPGLTNFNAQVDVESKNFTQEFRLTSPGSQKLTYLVGAIYTDTPLHFPYERDQLFPVHWDRHFKIDSLAAFARGTYNITDSDSITGGARYQHDRESYTWHFFPIAATDPNTNSAAAYTYGFGAGEFSYRHVFNDTINVYATYSRTETGQAIDMEDNADAAVGPLKPLDSAKAQAYELGLKSTLLDHRLTFNFDVYRINYQNFQFSSATTGSLTSVPVIRLLSIGKVRSQGAELAVNYQVSQELRVGLNGALTDASIQQYPGASCWTDQTAAQGCVNATQNVDGLSLPFTSRWKANATVDYTMSATEAMDVAFGGFYNYQTRQHSDVYGDPLSYISGYGTLNLYVGPAAKDGAWSIQAYCNNVFDKRNFAMVARSTFYTMADGTHPNVIGTFDRNSFRYVGLRADFKF
jgi:iron complex outermembrane recepter protein